ncbi:MAG: hypothetical protein PHN80_00195 [Hespellia sp.]|nr:hypothetical protein [Hespellia sp.]
MKHELPFYTIGTSYGGNQDWLHDLMMRMGGCAAVTVCDSSIYFSRYRGWHELYPYNADHVEKSDFISFTKILKPYLRPRMSGINTLELYMEGAGKYFEDVGNTTLKMVPFSGHEPAEAAKKAVKKQIDAKYPIPCLVLYHKNPKMKEYVWHWFLLMGYEETPDAFRVKTVTYGEAQWLSLEELWDTGHKERGGLILFSDK